ncbi:muscle, skeletal receptor tyrosine protein kinase-like isoform X2 [Myxocyprinus asiaticus]|uniref:muscle, skeletal receptor tyrosine protein kinase-like isoform X2 n=1 Tax=Myxocyprinus asiaticus TaxID=70543 RepID=UPI00222249B4|nr:muscle, skeletal receptor tyrosine protein kinase-like isoform X2 [Myxocyprinus asiaticus]XP_051575357.1 muscle, skeletal receptor tyrosine protein kinase-like isoform X2 [Myxocyprinus asiaticus]
MELQIAHFIRTVLLLQICLLWSGQCLSLHFTNQQPIYVIKGHSLILQVQTDLLHGERVAKVTWDHKAKNSAKNLTVAEFPGRVFDERVTVDQQGFTLKIRDYEPADSGVYTITVTNQSGQRRSEQQIVQDYLAVNHVSVMVNVSHCILHCMEAWGTEPTFTWLHEQAAVTEEVGRVSTDGTSLYVSSTFCGHFTCVVSNKLGHSSATYTAEPCERKNKATTAVVVCSLLLLLVATSLAFLLWRRHRYQSNRRERLREPYEDTL